MIPWCDQIEISSFANRRMEALKTKWAQAPVKLIHPLRDFVLTSHARSMISPFLISTATPRTGAMLVKSSALRAVRCELFIATTDMRMHRQLADFES